MISNNETRVAQVAKIASQLALAGVAGIKIPYELQPTYMYLKKHFWFGPSEEERFVPLFRYISEVALTDDPVLIHGESGTGKEIVARAIAQTNPQQRLFGINVTSLPDYLIESELFGHIKGAFTGAFDNHVGILESAAGCHVLLDEIGDMPVHLQPKLLRVLQEKQIRPVGSTQFRPISCKFIAATHQDVLAANSKFRKDLYWRLCVHTIELPPLRERKDLEYLIRFKLDEHDSLSKDDIALMIQRPYSSGNWRELVATVKRQLLIAKINANK